jgi:membrane-associated protein
MRFILQLDQQLQMMLIEFGSAIYLVLFLIICLETALVITPFLPGDSVLFTAGAFAASGVMNPWLLALVLVLATITGDNINFWFGSLTDRRLIPASFHLNHKYLKYTDGFYRIYGEKFIVIARFVPVVRTFAPFLAAISKMPYPVFFIFNALGGLIWVVVYVSLGYFLGMIPPFQDNLTLTLLIVTLVSLFPVYFEFIRQLRRHYRQQNPSSIG